MSKTISELLDASEPMFTLCLQQLEKITGNPSADVRLTAEIIGKVRLKCQELGLDPDDTNGQELYNALINRIRINDLELAKAIGGQSADNVAELLPLMKATFDKLEVTKTCWVLKKSVAKKFLKESPPPKIMEHLGYRSVDSMLKSENVFEIMGALRFAEGPEWLNSFNEKYKTLTPSDFESRQIEVIMMPHDRWADLCESFVHKKRHNITHLKEMGVILMLPMKMERMVGITMTCLPLLMHYLNEIKLYSSFFKMKQVQSDFGKVFVNTLIAEPPTAAVINGQNIHWRVIQRYFGKLENEYHPEIFEPHVQPEDLHWRRAEDILFDVGK